MTCATQLMDSDVLQNEEFGLNDINTKDFEILPEGQSDEPVLLPDRLSQVRIATISPLCVTNYQLLA